MKTRQLIHGYHSLAHQPTPKSEVRRFESPVHLEKHEVVDPSTNTIVKTTATTYRELAGERGEIVPRESKKATSVENASLVSFVVGASTILTGIGVYIYGVVDIFNANYGTVSGKIFASAVMLFFVGVPTIVGAVLSSTLSYLVTAAIEILFSHNLQQDSESYSNDSSGDTQAPNYYPHDGSGM